jgi:hypothetical protein
MSHLGNFLKALREHIEFKGTVNGQEVSVNNGLSLLLVSKTG